ncbi:hypothetical protein PROVRUST_06064 [Providencia rustigianii DSM 4541]|uniref:Uncharacterized protein n=1 Tax=Providencia rustigianii DSM 4541 TaxID=500637 RepID=D1P1J3_9GAMM|nr:hypothetical protein PROVRUST_06064 [Providencia rustigianii DSM 4541]
MNKPPYDIIMKSTLFALFLLMKSVSNPPVYRLFVAPLNYWSYINYVISGRGESPHRR